LIVTFITAISIIAWVFTPEIVRLLAPGFFAVPGKAELTIELTRVMMPFLLLIALAAQAMGMLNAFNIYGIPALASRFPHRLGCGLCAGISRQPAIGKLHCP
jgi:putative peptidoglycan lipid II flippase